MRARIVEALECRVIVARARDLPDVCPRLRTCRLVGFEECGEGAHVGVALCGRVRVFEVASLVDVALDAADDLDRKPQVLRRVGDRKSEYLSDSVGVYGRRHDLKITIPPPKGSQG